jgi:hypothetical protein
VFVNVTYGKSGRVRKVKSFQRKNYGGAAPNGKRNYSYIPTQDRTVIGQNAEWSLKVKWIKYALGLNIPPRNPVHVFERKPGFKGLSMHKF